MLDAAKRDRVIGPVVIAKSFAISVDIFKHKLCGASELITVIHEVL